FVRDPTIHVNAGDHQRPKKIAFAAFIDSEMGLEHFWCMHFFVTKFGLAQNLRFQLELHELLHAFTLDENLWSFLVNRGAQFILLSGKKRVLLWRKFEPKFIEQRTKFRRLFTGKWVCIGIHSRKRPTLNAQRSTSNAQLRIGRWTLNVKC